jgi:hypothetical protein
MDEKNRCGPHIRYSVFLNYYQIHDSSTFFPSPKITGNGLNQSALSCAPQLTNIKDHVSR